MRRRRSLEARVRAQKQCSARPDPRIFKDNDPTTGIITRTMPLCPYPAAAVFTRGDVSQASDAFELAMAGDFHLAV